MKASVTLLAVLVLTSGALMAQPPMAFVRQAPDIERLAVLLDLDAYQKNEVERILAEQGGQRRVGTYEEMVEHRRKTQAETREKLTLVLSEQQLTKFDVLMEDSGAGRVLLRRGQP